MPSDKRLDFTIGANAASAVTEYNRFVETVLTGAKRIQAAKANPLEDFAKVTSEVLKDAERAHESFSQTLRRETAERKAVIQGEFKALEESAKRGQAILEQVAAEDARRDRERLDESKRKSDEFLRNLETAGQRRVELEKRLAETLDRIQSREGAGKTAFKKDLRDSDRLRAQIEEAKALEAQAAKSGQVRAQIEETYSRKIREIDHKLENERKLIAERTGNAIIDAAIRQNKALESVEKSTTVFGRLQGALQPITDGIRDGNLSVDSFTAAFGNLVKVAGPAGPILAISLTVLSAVKDTVIALGRAVIDLGLETGKFAKDQETLIRFFGLSREEAAGLTIAVGDASEAIDLLGQANQNAVAAKNDPKGEAAQRFRDLEISATDAAGEVRKVGDILKDISELSKKGFSKPQLDAFFAIFGEDSAKKLLPIIEQFDELQRKAKAAGVVLTDDAARAAVEFAQKTKDLEIQLEGLKTTLGAALIPALLQAVPVIEDVLKQILELIKANPELFEGLATLTKFVATVAGAAFKSLAQFVTGVAKEFQALFTQAQAFVAFLSGDLDKAFALFNKASEQALSGSKNLMAAYGETFKNVAEGVGKLANAIFETAKGNLSKAAELARQAATQIKTAFKDVLSPSEFAGGQKVEGPAPAPAQPQPVEDLKQKVAEAKAALASFQSEFSTKESELTEQVNTGTKRKIDAAREYFNFVKGKQSEQLDQARAVRDAEVAAAGEDKAKRIEAETAYNNTVTSIRKQESDARSKLESVAADERSKIRERESEDLKGKVKQELDAVKVKEDTTVGYHETAYRQRLAISEKAVQSEIDLLKRQLGQENVGAAERERLNQEIRSKELELTNLTANAESELHARRLQDANKLLAVKNGQADVERAQVQAQIAQLSATSQLEQQNAGVIAGLKQRLLELDAQKIRNAIESRTAQLQSDGAEIESDLELLRLKAQLIQVEGERGAAAVAASEQAIDAATREKGAVEGVTGALGRQEDAAKSAIQASGAPIDTNSMEGLSRAIETVRNNYQNLRDAFTGSTGTGPGAFGFLNSAAQYLTQLADLERQQAELMRREAETARQERLEAARRDAEEMGRIRDAELDATERANDRLREAETRFRKGLEEETTRWNGQEGKLLSDGQKALESIQSEWDSRRAARAKTEADRLLQIERDLQKSRRDTELSARQSALDNEASRIVGEAEARKKLAEAKKSGDVEGQKEAEGQLADIDAARSRDKRQAEEEALARSKATSAEELQIQLDAIRDKYRNEAEFYEQSKGLQGAALEALRANFAAQQAAIEQARRDALADLSRRLSEEKTARDTAAAEEDAEYSSRLDKQREANRLAFDEARRAHVEKLGELQDALSKEEAEHEKSLAAIQTQTEEALAKMGKTWGDYFKFVKDGISSIGGTPGGGQPGSDSGAGGNDKGGGNGASIRTSDNDSGKITSGTSPDGSGKGGNSQRTPPPSPPPPKPTPPPAPSTGKTDFAEVGSNPFGQPQDQTDKFFNKDARPMLAQVVNLLRKGDQTGAREVFGVLRRLFAQRESSLTPEFARAVSRTLEAYEKKLKEAEGQSAPDEQQIVQDHAPPDRTGGPDAIGGGLKDSGQQIDKPGGPTVTGTQTKPTVDKPGDKPSPKPFDPGKEGADFPTTAQLILQRLTKKELTEKDALDAWKAAVSERPELRPFDAAVIKRIKEVGSKQKNVTGAATVGPSLTAQPVPDVNQATQPTLQPQGFEAVARAESDEAAKRAATASKAGRDGATVNQSFVLQIETMRQAVEAVEKLITDGAIAAGITVE